jgi:two-component system response regulator LytT
MNCIIIEDGQEAAEYLEFQLKRVNMAVDVLAKIGSVKDAVSWLKHHQTDLIFLDIQLRDGLSFEIFDHVQVNTPVVFTTSYDQYAIKAFEVNSISYLLKPIKLYHLKAAVEKFIQLKEHSLMPPAFNSRIFLHRLYRITRSVFSLNREIRTNTSRLKILLISVCRVAGISLL